MSQEVNITVYDTIETVNIDTTNEVVQVDVQIIQSTGAVSSVNGQTGTVVLDADDIDDTATAHKFVSASERTAITHSNRSVLDQITEAFTTALKSAYDSAATWISTNGANVLSHLSNTSNPHSVTATQIDALKRDGSNANSDVDLGAYAINAKSVKVNGTAGGGNVGLKHQSANATAGGQETALFAGSDGELYYKNDGNTVAQIASRAWVTLQGYLTSLPTATNLVAGITKLYTTTGNNTDGAMTQDAVTTALNGKQNSLGYTPRGVVVKDAALSANVTGTTAETVVSSYTIAGGRLSATDAADLMVKVVKSGTAGNITVRAYVNSVNSISGQTAFMSQALGLTTLSFKMVRDLVFAGGSMIASPSVIGVTDVTNSTSALSTYTLNPANTWYLIFTLQNGNAADTSNIRVVTLMS